uniref:NADH-ubiquinone oxidoreductase chain 4 n=1 Tax=Lachesilla anna TaxID=239245 RepID=A0A343QCG9_9NEOP|nr:NADH dehydrogenase subunit 4 [Lachesilla anna]ATU07116.1 NADH dehydrogenase subunit 4 [Lachesilla anna]
MLKFFFMILFMIPFIFIDWIYIQVMLILMSFMFMLEFSSFEFLEGLGLSMGLDLMSFTLIFLTFWVIFLMLLSSESIFYSNFFKKQFLFILLMLSLFLFLSFYATNMFMFYLWFESSLIPTFFLILGWGYQGERLQAGVYLLMYTLIFSLPLMIMIFWLFKSVGSSSMLLSTEKVNYMNFIMILSIYLAFLVKLPLFLFHLWLPKAHVEAPVSGSMILAGVLLKLGGYGIIRISSVIYKSIINYMGNFVILSLIGGVLISLVCLRQSDMKLLIAYSSVSHMGIMLAGLLTFSFWGLSSSLAAMLSHGLCSSGLFFLTNVFYERVGSRSFIFNKGMINVIPKLSLWWFLFCAMNMAAPPSLNLLGEIGLINSIVQWSNFSMIGLGLMGFFVAAYSLYLFSFSQHGKFSESIYGVYNSNAREFLILFLHWVPLNIFIVFGELFFFWI